MSDDNLIKQLNDAGVTMTLTSGPKKIAEDEKVEADFLLHISPDEAPSRCPTNICCVVDVSGSMNSEASIQGVESNGLSILDIVKHALNTIIKTLSAEDKLSIVSFSESATVVLPLTSMTTRGQDLALEKVSGLHPGGRTNLWDGLHAGLELFSEYLQETAGAQLVSNNSILVLTDGVPNIEPPRGHVPMLQRYRERKCSGGSYPAVISTFGFGYQLDSSLLRSLAVEGDGMYCFIPDSGFVGTAFVHALANQMVSVGTEAVLSLEIVNGASLNKGMSGSAVFGGIPHVNTSWGVQIPLGNLYSGLDRDIMFSLTLPESAADDADVMNGPWVEPTIKYLSLKSPSSPDARVPGETSGGWKLAEAVIRDDSDNARDLLVLHSFRWRLVEILTAAVQSRPSPSVVREQSAVVVAKWVTDMQAWLDGGVTSEKTRRVAVALLEDVSGQVTEALGREDYYEKWGKHYLPSLQRAHEMQQCNNFKDPGIQHYGGAQFQTVRDLADDVFCQLPPPPPSRKQEMDRVHAAYANSSSSGGSVALPVAQVVSMAEYNSSSAPCFHPLCEVRMADGSRKKVKDVMAGDKVASGGTAGPAATEEEVHEVECVVQTVMQSEEMSLVELPGGLVLTPWHPVLLPDTAIDADTETNKTNAAGANKWVFPCTQYATQKVACPSVYSFLLKTKECGAQKGSRGASMLLNGVGVLCLGHGIENDEVASHPFFGTEAVVESLRQAEGWKKGLVRLNEGAAIKDPVSGLTCGLNVDYVGENAL